MTVIATPAKTFALVVGIAKYKESSWNIKSGATVKDALKFTDWLLKQGVPELNIKLCLSLQEEHQEVLKSCQVPVETADQQNIVEIIDEFLSEKSGDLLYIYWAGHGLITSNRERRLLCAGLTKKNWQNLDFNSLLLSLNSDLCKIKNQIYIIDACANYILESEKRPANIGGHQFGYGQPSNSQQFILLATREGEKAKVNSQMETGYFSQAVFEALDKSPLNVFPPDMKAIADSVQQRFDDLNKDQTPTYLYRRNWDGTEREVNYDEPQQEDKKENDGSMNMTVKDNARGWQTKVNGGTAYIGEITVHQTPPSS